jgi:hypothetical protein
MYHASGNNSVVVGDELNALRKLFVNAATQQVRTRIAKNIQAVDAYRKIYGNRKFRVLPNKRMRYKLGNITLTAQPDLWVEEHATQILLKIGVARHKPAYISLLLSLLRKAAVSSGHRIRAKNVVYLNISSGAEVIASGGLTRFNKALLAAATQIEQVWPTVR